MQSLRAVLLVAAPLLVDALNAPNPSGSETQKFARQKWDQDLRPSPAELNGKAMTEAQRTGRHKGDPMPAEHLKAKPVARPRSTAQDGISDAQRIGRHKGETEEEALARLENQHRLHPESTVPEKRKQTKKPAGPPRGTDRERMSQSGPFPAQPFKPANDDYYGYGYYLKAENEEEEALSNEAMMEKAKVWNERAKAGLSKDAMWPYDKADVDLVPSWGNDDPMQPFSKLEQFKAWTTPAPKRFQLYRKEDGSWASSCPLNGVGLGNWFALEKWMTVPNFLKNVHHAADLKVKNIEEVIAASKDTPYEGSDASDVCTLSKKIGRAQLDTRMRAHLDSWITEKDFEYLASQGVNVVRLAVGYWNVIDDHERIYAPINPRVSFSYLDNAFQWAEKHNVAVILDQHGSPGSQNGWEHSGCSDNKANLWQEANMNRSVRVVEKLAERYSVSPALLGIQVINEPKNYEQALLDKLYEESYHAIRKHSKDVWVVLYSDHVNMTKAFQDETKYTNVVQDAHRYACFGGRPKPSIQGHRVLLEQWGKNLANMNAKIPTFVGEWSLCNANGNASPEFLKPWGEEQQKLFADKTIGSTFWSYKIKDENMHWSFRDIQAKHGLLNPDFKCMNANGEGTGKMEFNAAKSLVNGVSDFFNQVKGMAEGRSAWATQWNVPS